MPKGNVKKGSFTELVQSARFGNLQNELDQKLNKCVLKTRETGKVSKLTVTFTFKPAGVGQYQINDETKLIIPEGEKGSTNLFGTPEGNLTEDNPEIVAKKAQIAALKGGES